LSKKGGNQEGVKPEKLEGGNKKPVAGSDSLCQNNGEISKKKGKPKAGEEHPRASFANRWKKVCGDLGRVPGRTLNRPQKKKGVIAHRARC